MPTRLPVIAVTSAALVLSGCQAPSASTSPGVPTIVATTTVLGSVVEDLTQCIGDDVVQTSVLMPIGADPHDFAPSSEQMALMSRSGLVVANGLGLEQGLMDALDQIEADGGKVFHVAEWVDPLLFSDDGHDDDQDDHADEPAMADEHDHGDFDPHFWFDMARMAEVARQLGVELEAEFGSDALRCGEEIAGQIETADVAVAEILQAIPDERKVLVTDHKAFGYFAEHYDFDIAGVVIPGGSTLAEPSSQELADLIATITALGVPAMVSDYFEPSAVLESVAKEAGDITVIPLYVGSVGQPDGDASDYESMMIANATALAETLG